MKQQQRKNKCKPSLQGKRHGYIETSCPLTKMEKATMKSYINLAVMIYLNI